MEHEERDEYRTLVSDLSARLRRACGYLSDDEFSALVHRIAQVTMRLRSFDGNPLLLRPIRGSDLTVAPPSENDAPRPPTPND